MKLDRLVFENIHVQLPPFNVPRKKRSGRALFRIQMSQFGHTTDKNRIALRVSFEMTPRQPRDKDLFQIQVTVTGLFRFNAKEVQAIPKVFEDKAGPMLIGLTFKHLRGMLDNSAFLSFPSPKLGSLKRGRIRKA